MDAATLAQLEGLCETLYKAQDAQLRAHSENVRIACLAPCAKQHVAPSGRGDLLVPSPGLGGPQNLLSC